MNRNERPRTSLHRTSLGERFYEALKKGGAVRCTWCGEYRAPEHWQVCPRFGEEKA